LPNLVGDVRLIADRQMSLIRDNLPGLRLPYPVGFIRELKGHTGGINDVALTPDGRRAFSASSSDGTLRFWDVNSGRELNPLKYPRESARLALSPNGKRALAGFSDGTLRLFDVTTAGKERELASWRSHDNRGVLAVAFAADGQSFVTSGRDKTVRVWTMTGKEVRRFAVALEPLHGLAFSADFRRVLAMGERIAVLYDGNGKELRKLEGHPERLHCSALSRDGRRAILGCLNHPLQLWDLDTAKPLGPVGRQNSAWTASISPDARRILGGGWDRHVYLWEVENGNLLRDFEGHTGRIDAVAFSGDGRLAVSASEDNTLRLWGLPDLRAAKAPR
jgi:WD40 repeat protein